MLAYLFIPFEKGTKPPTVVVTGAFLVSLATVVASITVYNRVSDV